MSDVHSAGPDPLQSDEPESAHKGFEIRGGGRVIELTNLLIVLIVGIVLAFVLVVGLLFALVIGTHDDLAARSEKGSKILTAVQSQSDSLACVVSVQKDEFIALNNLLTAGINPNSVSPETVKALNQIIEVQKRLLDEEQVCFDPAFGGISPDTTTTTGG